MEPRYFLGIAETTMPAGMYEKLAANDIEAKLEFSKLLPSLIKKEDQLYKERMAKKDNDTSRTST